MARHYYDGRFVEKFLTIPSLPQHYDNANDMYELIAWLQSAYLRLNEDNSVLYKAFGDFQKDLLELIAGMVPDYLQRYINSKEFTDKLNGLIEKLYTEKWKPELEKLVVERVESEVTKKLDGSIETLVQRIVTEKLGEGTIEKITNTETKVTEVSDKLDVIINNLTASGAWEGNTLKQGRNLVTGNINLYSGEHTDGNGLFTRSEVADKDIKAQPKE